MAERIVFTQGNNHKRVSNKRATTFCEKDGNDIDADFKQPMLQNNKRFQNPLFM